MPPCVSQNPYDRDAPRPGLDQAAGDQELVVVHGRGVAQRPAPAGAVAVAQPGVFSREVQRPGDLVGGQHVESPAVDAVHAADVGVVDTSPELVELAEEGPAAIEPWWRDVGPVLQ